MGFLSNFFSKLARRQRSSLPVTLPNLSDNLSFPSESFLPGTKGLGGSKERQKNRASRKLSDSLTIRREERVHSKELSFMAPSDRREWVYPEYDHEQIEILFDVESYFARSVRAKLALFIKEGYEFTGSEEKYVYYIKERVAQIERATGVSFRSLLTRTGRDLFVHSNAYWLKVRNTRASGGRVRSINGRTIKPVAGFFLLPADTMSIEIDQNNKPTRYEQTVNGVSTTFSAEDIVHFTIHEKSGYPFGVPAIVSVVGDIRTLRSIEENVDVLVHKHVMPVVLWKVGTTENPASVYPGGRTEIDEVQSVVSRMPLEGSIVVSERYSVDILGVESKALRVETYLTYFRERLLAGLDVSSIDVGIGSTTTRSTAQTLSRNIIDAVKFYQIAVENQISIEVIPELLLESTFPENKVKNPRNRVYLKFHEIDKQSQIATSNHYMDLFLKNGITYPELRKGLGLEPLSEEEESELFWTKFKKPELELTISLRGSMFGSSSNAGEGSVQTKNRPSNQHGEEQGPKLNKDFQ